MKRKLKTFSVSVLVLTIILNVLSLTGYAAESSPNKSSAEAHILRTERTLGNVYNKDISKYERFYITYQGRQISQRGFIKDGTYYLPLRALAEHFGLSYAYDASAKMGAVSGKGLVMTVGANCYVSYANGRALFSEMPAVIMGDGRLYAPSSVILKAFSLNSQTKYGTFEIFGSFRALASAASFYRQDEVLWLARIIHAESRGEPLLGQIAVGTIVMNRVAHRDYPNTIYSVIFDRKYGVQFSPILDGSIYNTPSYNSTLAAKISLEGYRVDSGVLFFLEPRLSTSSWIPKNREYAFTIGNHDFYR
jgi:N-acetylmuramoyl-L-alanine amidase